MAVVSRARLFVGVDSSFSHVANAAAVPSVLLLGIHLGYRTNLPLSVRDHDIVLRGNGQTHQIEVEAVSDGVSRLCVLIGVV
jgi:ADP-heptose:LPS heptosyltransferase